MGVLAVNDNVRPAIAGTGTVVILGGLACPSWAMGLFGIHLRRAGYRTQVGRYRRDRVADIAGRLCGSVPVAAGPVHFVGHSLGGLVALALADAMPPSWRGRVVAVGTPLNGSGIAARLHALGLIEPVLGPVLHDLLPAGRAGAVLTNRPVRVGMIAGEIPGTRRLGYPTDGTVAVAETLSPLLADHLVVPASHQSLLLSPRVMRSVVEFLGTGRFGADAS